MPADHLNSERPASDLTAEERELGMHRDITRRDFLNAAALGAGAALLGLPAPAGRLVGSTSASGSTPGWDPWTGYPGVGDYARSNGNTRAVMEDAHAMRDGKFKRGAAGATATGETYDLVVVGGGIAGLTAAYAFQQETSGRRTCLVLDNHALMGGEAKRNEFRVQGQRLIGPQGSNNFGVPSSSGWSGTMWRDIGLPTEFRYGALAPERRQLEFPRDNYYYQFWADDSEQHGFFFESPKPQWVRNPWGHELAGTPWSEELRREFLRWRVGSVEPFKGTQEEADRWLDTMTYEQYLVGVCRFPPEVARYADPILASAVGLGTDVLSAYVARSLGFPAFPGRTSRITKLADIRGSHSFPGGNDAIARCIARVLIPAAYEGTPAFDDVHNKSIRFDALDRPNQPCRIRVATTVVAVEGGQDKSPSAAPATVTYLHAGRLYSVRARTVIVASGAWAAKHVVRQLPEEYREALQQFPRSPMLVVNVALTNWRFLYNLGFTACSWRGGFGYTCSLRSNMYVGDYQPPLDPDQPNLLTFYVPFSEPGLSLEAQGTAGRQRLLAMSYRDYERTILQHLVKLFGSSGFDPKRDVAGLVLNRWGHAYVNPGPGFFFGRAGRPAPSAVLRKPLGRIAFAHSELQGHQTWSGAAGEGRRAAQQVSAML